MGFEQAGFKIVWTNEVNPVFAGLYEHGMTAWRRSRDSNAAPAEMHSRTSIDGLSPRTILKKAFPKKRPKVFGIIGGPPCSDFSNAGKQHGGKGTNGRLTRIFVNRICKIRPSFFMLENVAGLYRTKRHRKFLEKLEQKLEAHGYHLDARILNALELGVPQDRERLVLVGVRHHLARNYLRHPIVRKRHGWFPWPVKRRFKDAKTRFSWPGKVSNGNRVLRINGTPIELTVFHALNGGTPLSALPNGREGFKPYSVRFKNVLEGDTKRKSFKRLHRFRYSPTACYGHNEVHLHPWKDRRLTVREAMRIQGIPDSYVLPREAFLGPKFTLISNGVPVPLGRAVALSLRKFLLRSTGRTSRR